MRVTDGVFGNWRFRPRPPLAGDPGELSGVTTSGGVILVEMEFNSSFGVCILPSILNGLADAYLRGDGVLENFTNEGVTLGDNWQDSSF